MAIDQSQVETLITNFQERQQRIEQHEEETRNRLALVECYMPSILAWNVWRALEAKQLQTRAQKLEAENNRLCDRVDLLDNEKKKVQDSSGITRTPDDESISLSVETCRDRIKEGGSPIIRADVTRVGQTAGMATVLLKPDAINNVANEISNQPMTQSHTGLFAPENELSLLPATDTLSESASPQEFERIRQLQQMAVNEMEMKKRIEQMERRENVYMEALQRAEELCTLVSIPSNDDIIVALQILIPQLESENRRLRDLEFTLEGQLKRLNVPIPQKIQEIQDDDAKYAGDVGPPARPLTVPSPVADETPTQVVPTEFIQMALDTATMASKAAAEAAKIEVTSDLANEAAAIAKHAKELAAKAADLAVPVGSEAAGEPVVAEYQGAEQVVEGIEATGDDVRLDETGASGQPQDSGLEPGDAGKIPQTDETEVSPQSEDTEGTAQQAVEEIPQTAISTPQPGSEQMSTEPPGTYQIPLAQFAEETADIASKTAEKASKMPETGDLADNAADIARQAKDLVDKIADLELPVGAALDDDLSVHYEPVCIEDQVVEEDYSDENLEGEESEQPEATEMTGEEEAATVTEISDKLTGTAEPVATEEMTGDAEEVPQELELIEQPEAAEVIEEPVVEDLFEEAEDTAPVPEEFIEAAESGKPMSDMESLSELTRMAQETAEMATKTAEIASKTAEEARAAEFAPAAKVATDIDNLATALAERATNLEYIIKSGREEIDLEQSPWPIEEPGEADQAALVQMAQDTAEMASKTAKEASKVADSADVAGNAADIAKIALDLASKAADLSTSAKVIGGTGEDEVSLHFEPVVVEDQVVEEDFSEIDFTNNSFNEIPPEEDAGEAIEVTNEAAEVEANAKSDEGPVEEGPSDEAAPSDDAAPAKVEEPEPTLAEMAALTASAASETAYEAAQMAEMLQDQANPENTDVLNDAISMASEAVDIAKQASALAEIAADSRAEDTERETAAAPVDGLADGCEDVPPLPQFPPIPKNLSPIDELSEISKRLRIVFDHIQKCPACREAVGDSVDAFVSKLDSMTAVLTGSCPAAAGPSDGPVVSAQPPSPPYASIPSEGPPPAEEPAVAPDVSVPSEGPQAATKPAAATDVSVPSEIPQDAEEPAAAPDVSVPSEGPQAATKPGAAPDVYAPSVGPEEEPVSICFDDTPFQMPDPDDSFLLFETTYSRTTAEDFNFGPIGSCVLEPPKPFGFTDSQLALAFEEEVVEPVELGSHEQLFQDMFPDIAAAVVAQQEALLAQMQTSPTIPEDGEIGEEQPIAADKTVVAESTVKEPITAEPVKETDKAKLDVGEPVIQEFAKREPQMPDTPGAAQQYPKYNVTSDSNLPDLILAMTKMASKTAEEAEKLKRKADAEPGTTDPALIHEVANQAADIARQAAELEQKAKELDLTEMPPGEMEVTLSFLRGEPIQIPGPEDSFLAFESTYSRTTADDFNFGPTGSCVLEPAKPFGFTDSQLAVAFEEQVIEPVELGSQEQLFQDVFPGIVATIAAQEEARLAELQQQQLDDGTTAAVPAAVSEPVEEAPAETGAVPGEKTEPTEEAPVEAEVTEIQPEDAAGPTEEAAEVPLTGPEEAVEEIPAETEVTEAEPEAVEPTEEASQPTEDQVAPEVTEAGPEEAAQPMEEQTAPEDIEAGPEEAAQPTEEQAAPEVTEAGPEEAAQPTEEQAAPEVTEAGLKEAAQPTEEQAKAEVTDGGPEEAAQPTEEQAVPEVLTNGGLEEAAQPTEEQAAPEVTEDTGISDAPEEVVEQVFDFAEAPTSQQPEREPKPIIEKVTEDEALNDLLVSLQQRALAKSNEIIEIKKLLGDLDRQQKNLMATLGQAGPSTAMPAPMPGPMSVPDIGDDSGMIATIAALQEKCRLKDHLIGVMVDELRVRTQSGVWENLLTNIAAPGSPQPDFTRSDVSERLRTGEDKPPAPKLPCDCKGERTGAQECQGAPNIPTFPKGGPTIGVPNTLEATDGQCVCPTDFRIIRQIGFDSLLLSWKACTTPTVVGYEIYVNGILSHKVRSNTRDRALLQCLDLSTDLDIKLFARLNTGQLTGGTQITYSAKR